MYRSFIESNKFEKEIENFHKYQKEIISPEWGVKIEVLTQYLRNEYQYILDERDPNGIRVSAKYSKYATFVWFKNKNLPRKNFKTIMADFADLYEKRGGGEIINLQYKDVSLVVWLEKV